MTAIEIGIDTLAINGDPTKLYEALAKAQAEFLPVPKADAGQVGFTKFKYASYATLIRCVRPALTKYGIAVCQPLHSRNGLAVTTTILAGHGASIVSSFSFQGEFKKKIKEVVELDPQEFGRHHTYYRRYQLQAMLGIEGDKDADELPDVNDAAQYEDRAAPRSEPKTAPAPAPKSAPAAAAAPEVPATNGAAKAAKVNPAPSDMKTLNELLEAAMKQLSWKMNDVRAFYVEHVDKAGFAKASSMSIEQKQQLLTKLIEHKNVAPF